jgi:7-carboxy-7-deazaguanine synthase
MKLSEVYSSVQGEGPNVGEPTTFVRFGGCNLRCPGWGEGELPDGRIVQGCDTVFAVYPEWRSSWNSITVNDLLDEIPTSPQRVCITGGEPLIQRQAEINQLAEMLIGRGQTIDLFTNGSRLLKNHEWSYHPSVTVVMDYKLPSSGEYGSFESVNWYSLRPKDAIKFVVADENDVDTALVVLEQFGGIKVDRPQVYFGVVWDKDITEGELVDIIGTYYPEGKLNIQTHKYLWDPEERRR